MKNQKWLIFFVALVLMAGMAGLLLRLKANQKLGQPGINAAPISGSVQMKIDLPERVLDFTSTNIPESAVELGYFPKDTSFTCRSYQSAGGNDPIYGTIVMMGADRTSIHKPDYCLPGQGWHIDSKTIANVSIDGAQPYQLPVAEWKISRVLQLPDGQKITSSGIYAFWFVADKEQTPSFYGYLKRLTFNFFRTGVLQRWAYVSYFSTCAPGQEDATFARMEKLIAASVPQFQPPPR
jgi:hypothetical protein